MLYATIVNESLPNMPT